MKKSEIVVGGRYVARVSKKLVIVRVDKIVPGCAPNEIGYHGTRYLVTNLSTNKNLTFRSAAKFRYSDKGV